MSIKVRDMLPPQANQIFGADLPGWTAAGGWHFLIASSRSSATLVARARSTAGGPGARDVEGWSGSVGLVVSCSAISGGSVGESGRETMERP